MTSTVISSFDEKKNEIEELINNLTKSGYNHEKLKRIENVAIEYNQLEKIIQDIDTLTFPIFYFDGLNDLKNIIYDSIADVQTLIGNISYVCNQTVPN